MSSFIARFFSSVSVSTWTFSKSTRKYRSNWNQSMTSPVSVCVPPSSSFLLLEFPFQINTKTKTSHKLPIVSFLVFIVVVMQLLERRWKTIRWHSFSTRFHGWFMDDYSLLSDRDLPPNSNTRSGKCCEIISVPPKLVFKWWKTSLKLRFTTAFFFKFFNRVSGLISCWFLHPVPKFLKGSVEQGLQMSCKSFLCFSVVFFFLMWKRYSNISPRCVTLMISHTEILMKPMLNRLERAGGCCNRFWFGGWKRQN